MPLWAPALAPTLSGWEALGGCWKVSRCRPGRKLWVTQASRDVTKTGAGPHQPTVPEICSPRQRACSVRIGGWGSGLSTALPPPTLTLVTHQAEGGSSRCVRTSRGHQAPGEELQGC